ncbi:MAG: sigma-54-dependent transcriptional regulator [Planctomycetota bacterium]
METQVRQNVLILNGDSQLNRSLLAILAGRGARGIVTSSPDDALSQMSRQRWDLVVFDRDLFNGDAAVFVRQAKQASPELPVVAVSDTDSAELAVEAVRSGCKEFLVRPVDYDRLAGIIESMLPTHAVNMACQTDGVDNRYQIAGKSAEFLATIELARRVAPTSAPVLITGESGTGKELLSHLIHRESRRADGPYVLVNCASLSESLLESELFGHERGAFTGANARRLGRFERADGGTILLDEISETGPRLQAELLRVLEQQEIERLGGDGTVRLDIRVITTSNRDLAGDVAAGRFRRDLYHRISGVHLTVPPLRQRPDDIDVLVWHFVNQYAHEVHRSIKELDADMMSLFRRHPWPGNVRQLRNAVRAALILGEGPTLSLPDHMPLMADNYVADAPADQRDGEGGGTKCSLQLQEVERETILEALRRTKSNHAKAARLLGITDRTLRDKVRRYRQQEEAQAAGEAR